MKVYRKLSGTCKACGEHRVVKGYWFNYLSCEPYFNLMTFLHVIKHGEVRPSQIIKQGTLFVLCALLEVATGMLKAITYPAWWVHEML